MDYHLNPSAISWAKESNYVETISVLLQFKQGNQGIVLKERGAAVILITHDMGVIAETTDRVAVLYAGRFVEEGLTADVLATPRHPYTKGLMASTPNLDTVSVDTVLPQIPGSMPGLGALPDGCRFHPRCGVVMPNCSSIAPVFGNGVACHKYTASAADESANG